VGGGESLRRFSKGGGQKIKAVEREEKESLSLSLSLFSCWLETHVRGRERERIFTSDQAQNREFCSQKRQRNFINKNCTNLKSIKMSLLFSLKIFQSFLKIKEFTLKYFPVYMCSFFPALGGRCRRAGENEREKEKESKRGRWSRQLLSLSLSLSLKTMAGKTRRTREISYTYEDKERGK